jgi:hypothetical protein
MKKTVALLFLGCLISTSGYCQLLSDPSLTAEDFETALTDTGHLRKILKKHNFEYSATGEIRLMTPETMLNPLIPDLRAVRSEHWVPKNYGDQAIMEITMYEWEPNYAPHQGVTKTIRVMIRRDPEFTDKINEFYKEIGKKYPNKSQRYFRDSELYKSYGEPFNVFSNDSKIEVRTEPGKSLYGLPYIINFDLVR